MLFSCLNGLQSQVISINVSPCITSGTKIHADNIIQGGFPDFNVYPYQTKVNHDSTFTINAFMRFSNCLSYLNLTHFNNQDDRVKSPNLDNFFTVQSPRLTNSA